MEEVEEILICGRGFMYIVNARKIAIIILLNFPQPHYLVCACVFVPVWCDTYYSGLFRYMFGDVQKGWPNGLFFVNIDSLFSLFLNRQQQFDYSAL